MTGSEPVLAGALAGHAFAREFAAVIQQVHHRYATEVVGAFTLCPFMKEPETAFGRFCVVLDEIPDVPTAASLVLTETSQVAHLIYPLVTLSCAEFERFGGELHRVVAASGSDAPVHATFHPDMEGDRNSSARIVGLLRRAPDPFVQFVPAGLHEGGTQFIDPRTFDWSKRPELPEGNADSLFERLAAIDFDRIDAIQKGIRAERDERYQRFLDAML
jgi:hypothetical protein